MAELKLNHKVPITAYEGVTVKVKADGSFYLLFHQMTDEGGSVVQADVVAAVSIPNAEQWKKIVQLVEEQLRQALSREP